MARNYVDDRVDGDGKDMFRRGMGIPSWRHKKGSKVGISETRSGNFNWQCVTHMRYIERPSMKKVPALIPANLTVFVVTKTSMYWIIPGNMPRGRSFLPPC